MFFFLSLILVVSLILFIFFFLSKSSQFDILSNSAFECGFTSYFFSRFSFSVHYFMVGLIFLFLDLELCYLMPFFNEDSSNLILNFFLWFFVFVLILGLIEEWFQGLLEWKN